MPPSTDTLQGTYTPAEIVAASRCYLARWRSRAVLHGTVTEAVTERVATFWHEGTCRFCKESMDALLAVCRTSIDPATEQLRRQFASLPPAARLARVREAQAEPWWDSFVDDDGAPS